MIEIGVGSAGGIFFAYILIGSNSTHFADGGKMDNEHTTDLYGTPMYFFNVMQYNMRDGIGKTGPRIAGTGMESPTPEDPCGSVPA